MTTREPVIIDNIPVELSPANQSLWDTGNEAKRAAVREIIRGYREKDGPQFDPPTEDYVPNVGQRHFQDD